MYSQLTKQAGVFFWDIVIHLLTDSQLIRRLVPKTIIFLRSRQNLNMLIAVAATAVSGFASGMFIHFIILP